VDRAPVSMYDLLFNIYFFILELQENSEILIFLIGASAVMLFLALIVVLIFFVSHKRISAKNQYIQQRELQYQTELFDYTIEAMEVERKRFATDLHDEIGTKLSILRFQLEKLNYYDNENQNAKLIMENIHEISHNLRRISYNIMPASLELFGLRTALLQMVENLNLNDKLCFSIECEKEIALQSTKILSIYRIIQELCNNSLKHSGATSAQIILSQNMDNMSLIYKDNGRGLNPDSNDGLGMRSIANRLTKLEAIYSWKNVVEHDEGMYLSMSIPISINH